MIKDDVLHAIEDMLDESAIPMKEYCTNIRRDNGGFLLNICRDDDNCIPHMYLFSEIFNAYTQGWFVRNEGGKIHLVVS